MSKPRLSPYLLLTLTTFFWSCNWVLGRALHADVPPMAMTFFRWLFAAIILAPFVVRTLARDWPTLRAHWRTMLWLGAIGVGLHNALVYLALNYTSATNGVLLNSFIPVMIIAMAWLFFGERLTRMQLAGVAVSLCGVLAILSGGSLETLASFRLNVGDILVILAMVMWSLYTVLLRHRPPGIHALSFLFALAVIGDLCILPFWLAEDALWRTTPWTPLTLAALLGAALFSSVLAYIFWNRGVQAVGPQVAGLFVHLMPAFGVVLAWIFLDERLHAYHVAGIALILIGIVLTARRAGALGAQSAAAEVAGPAGAKAAEMRK